MGESHNGQQILKVLVTGGGPVGLSFALLLQDLTKSTLKVAIKVYDGRWMKEVTGKKSRVVWKGENERNNRRQQVVTIQSQQYDKFPEDIKKRLFFAEGKSSEMWPLLSGEKDYPRNVRISHLENILLEIANEKENIELIPRKFVANDSPDEIKTHHLLVIAEGAGSKTRDFFLEKLGRPDETMYSLDNKKPLKDLVLGLRVKSSLPDPMSVVLTIGQNRLLLNSLNGEGFLNMRLTDEEGGEVKGVRDGETVECIQSQPCLMEAKGDGTFECPTHEGSMFRPAHNQGSALMRRIRDSLKLFGVKDRDLTAITAWPLSMVQRPRFTAQLYPPLKGKDRNTPGTFGALLGDAANSIHFWPGRGLNTGLVSAISLARCLKSQWRKRNLSRGGSFRDSDFLRHEAIMAMLQYRNKNRAWRAMATLDSKGKLRAIKSKIGDGTDSKLTNGDPLVQLDEQLTQLDKITVIERQTGNKERLETMKSQQFLSLKEAEERYKECVADASVWEEAHQEYPDNRKFKDYASEKREKADRAQKTFKENESNFRTSLNALEKDIYREALLKRLTEIGGGLKNRIKGTLPEKKDYTERLQSVTDIETLRTLYLSGPWDTEPVRGEEVDIDLLLPDPQEEPIEHRLEAAEKRGKDTEDKNKGLQHRLEAAEKRGKDTEDKNKGLQHQLEAAENKNRQQSKELEREKQGKYWWSIIGIIVGIIVGILML